ncbi:MAG TPA: glycine rich domain-containing protein [Bacilli bacterium]|nr:glycine rich domain-containing protein [Bacilli bacterium]
MTCSYHYSGYVFTNANMIAGNASMPTHDGTSTMTGNSGNGYARITYLGKTLS